MITDPEAIALARQVAEVEGWAWLEPVAVTREISRKSKRDARSYDLIVKAGLSGCDCANIYVRIDGDTGEVLDGFFHGGRSLPVHLEKSRLRPVAD